MFNFKNKNNAPSRSPQEQLDFDEEARKLWTRLNLEPSTKTGCEWNALDAIYRHPTGGGTIYVGNQTAAQEINILS